MPDKSDRMDECAEAVGKARDFRQEIVAAAGLLPQTYISGTEKTDGNKAVPHSIASCGCIYPHCEGSSQPSIGEGISSPAVFTLIARGVHS